MNSGEEPNKLAALDLGSNSFHMIIAQIRGGQLQIVDKLREMVRLRAGLDEDGILSEEAQERALACLQRFGQRLRSVPNGCIRAVGTNTLRKANNAGEFLNKAAIALGHPIEIIAGDEEARLIYLGVAHGLDFDDAPRLVIDIGGGSTEFIIGTGFTAKQRESLGMGCVSFSMRYFPDGVTNENNMRQAIIAARSLLLDIDVQYRELGWQQTVASSGTARAIGKIVAACGYCPEGTITRDALQQVRNILVNTGTVEGLRGKGVNDERLPVIAGGVAILQAAFYSLGIDKVRVASIAMREGLLYDFLGRLRREGDVRSLSVQHMAHRYDVDDAHAQQVQQTCMSLFDQVVGTWNLNVQEDDLLLSWAALLYSVGQAISHSKYHKHSSYLVEHSDMAGFSRQEQNMLACVIRSHRRTMSNNAFINLQEIVRKRALRLCLLLRLAVLVNRGRDISMELPMQIKAKGNRIRLFFPKDWLQNHPLLQADLLHEQYYIEQIGIRFELHTND
ncbi:MAG: exopolyphosphatase [Mariprofundales bacterium]